MNNNILLTYLIIQLVVQLVMYFPCQKVYSNILRFIYPATKHQIFYDVFGLTKVKYNPQKFMLSMFTIGLFGLNILISLFVKLFTASGGMTGMTNLGASVLVGFVSLYHIYKFKKQLN